MKLGAAALLLIILGLPSLAQSESCDGNVQEMLACLARSLKAVDAQLNEKYQKALGVAKAHRHGVANVQNLRDTERKWIGYRDAICEEYGLVDGGTGGQSTQLSCLIRITKQRIADLEADY